LKFKPQHGNGGSPIVHGGKLYFTCDGSDTQDMVALDAATGEIAWKQPRGTKPRLGFAFTTPTVIEVNGKKQVIAPGAEAAMAYDPADGKEIWRVNYQGFSLIQRPIYAHGLVFLNTSYMSPTLIAVKPTGQGDVTNSHVVYRVRKGVPNTPSYLIVGDELYMVSDAGVLTCLDAKTGTVHYAERLPGRGYSASPIHADGKIYLTSESGTGCIVPVGKKFELAYRTEMEEKTFATFVPGDGAMYVRTETQLYKFAGK
jgi:outer membrane protein assembly factor BamB